MPNKWVCLLVMCCVRSACNIPCNNNWTSPAIYHSSDLDGYTVYIAIYMMQKVKKVCWVHILKRLHDLHISYSDTTTYGKPLVQSWYACMICMYHKVVLTTACGKPFVKSWNACIICSLVFVVLKSLLDFPSLFLIPSIRKPSVAVDDIVSLHTIYLNTQHISYSQQTVVTENGFLVYSSGHRNIYSYHLM